MRRKASAHPDADLRSEQHELRMAEGAAADLKQRLDAATENRDVPLLAAEKNMVATLSAEVAEKDEHIQELNNTVSTLRAQILPAIERFDRAEDLNSELRRRIKQLENEHDEEQGYSQSTHDQLANDLQEADLEIGRLSAQVGQLRKAHEEELDAVVEDNTSLREQLESERKAASEAQQKQHEMLMEADRFRQQAESLRQSQNELQPLVNELNMHLDHKQAELDKALGENQVLSEEITRRLDDEEALLSKLKDQREVIGLLEQQYANAQAQIEPLEKSLSQQYNDFQQIKSDMQAEFDKLQGEAITVAKQLGGMRIENNKLQSNIGYLHGEHGKATAENGKLREIIRSFETQQQRLTGEMETLQEKLHKQAQVSLLQTALFSRVYKERICLLLRASKHFLHKHCADVFAGACDGDALEHRQGQADDLTARGELAAPG